MSLVHLPDQTTTVYLVRHGETGFNRQMIIQGQGVDSSLNKAGFDQAAKLSDRFASAHLDVVYSSHLKRAQQTATVVAERHQNVSLRTEPGLEEISFGDFEGCEFTGDIRERFLSLRDLWSRGLFDEKPQGGESILDVQKRGVAALNRILIRHSGEVVFIVTHGRFLRILLSSILPEYGLARMEEVAHANTGVNQIVLEPDGVQCALMNCVEHLDGARYFVYD